MAGPLFLTNAPFSCMVMLFDAILTGDDPMTLQEFFARHPEAAVAFSGGVDSAWLLHEAARYARRCAAYFVNTPFQPAFELADARETARQIGAELRVLELDVLAAPEVAANPPDRCYHCKKRLFTAIADAAEADGYHVLLDGTNASDDASDRPGMRALRELRVLSPLRLCGVTKAQVRENAKAAGLGVWDKPSYACLATRVPAGEAIRRLRALTSTVEQDQARRFATVAIPAKPAPQRSFVQKLPVHVSKDPWKVIPAGTCVPSNAEAFFPPMKTVSPVSPVSPVQSKGRFSGGKVLKRGKSASPSPAGESIFSGASNSPAAEGVSPSALERFNMPTLPMANSTNVKPAGQWGVKRDVMKETLDQAVEETKKNGKKGKKKGGVVLFQY